MKTPFGPLARKIPGLGRIQRFLDELLGRGHSDAEPDPDGMHARTLVGNIENFRLQDLPVGSSVRLSPGLRDRVLLSFAKRAEEFLSKELDLSVEGIDSDVEDFFRLLKSNPARNYQSGSTSDRQNLWLHLLTTQLEPETVVESGVFVGKSLYTLREAAPDASLHAFDIDLGGLKFQDESISYHEYDWSESDVNCDNQLGLCHFDDHINNGRRIREAYERGFKHLVFDDCPRVSEMHSYRYPGAPTAMMIARDELEEGDCVEYHWNEKKLRYQFEPDDTWGAEKVIDTAHYFPPFEEGGTQVKHFAYVRLK